MDEKQDRYVAIEQSFARTRSAWAPDIQRSIIAAQKGNLETLIDYIRGRDLTTRDREFLVHYLYEIARPRRSRRDRNVWEVVKIVRLDERYSGRNGRLPQKVRTKLIEQAMNHYKYITGVSVKFESVDYALRRPVPKALKQRSLISPYFSRKT